jgi:hypothetical protein
MFVMRSPLRVDVCKMKAPTPVDVGRRTLRAMALAAFSCMFFPETHFAHAQYPLRVVEGNACC